MPNDRKSLLIGLEKNSLIEFRKILFENGLSPNEFFAHIVELININDERIKTLITEIKSEKINKIIKGETIKYTSDSLYDVIEEKLRK